MVMISFSDIFSKRVIPWNFIFSTIRVMMDGYIRQYMNKIMSKEAQNGEAQRHNLLGCSIISVQVAKEKGCPPSVKLTHECEVSSTGDVVILWKICIVFMVIEYLKYRYSFLLLSTARSQKYVGTLPFLQKMKNVKLKSTVV